MGKLIKSINKFSRNLSPSYHLTGFSPSKSLEDMNKKPTAAPTAPAVTPLPDAGDAAVRQRQKEALMALRRGAGRSSTILSGQTGDSSRPTTTQRKLGRG